MSQDLKLQSPSRERRRLVSAAAVLLGAALVLALVPTVQAAESEPDMERPAVVQERMDRVEAEATRAAQASARSNRPHGHEPCVRGMAGEFPCHRVDLMSYLTMDEIGGGPTSQYGGPGSDVWGWTDPDTRQEWAIQTRANGTSFVDVTDPKRPVYTANLPTQTTATLWRDAKTYGNYVFVVSEASGHGMQVFDMTRLRDIDPADAPVDVTPDAHYGGFGNAHNLTINVDSGFAYAVGATQTEHAHGMGNNDHGDDMADQDEFDTCGGGPYIVDIRDPLNPTGVGCYGDEGYTHFAQCVNYHGPDDRYSGRELCIASNPRTPEGDALSIVDMTDKENPQLVARATYSPSGYSHDAWLTPDHRYAVHSDEFDELITGRNTLTHMFDLSDLENPVHIGVHEGRTPATSHKGYTKGRYHYQSNYFAGLSVMDVTGIGDGDLEEVAWFDSHPEHNNAGFGSTWGAYPFFRSGTVLLGGFDGLWVLRPRVPHSAPWPPQLDHRNPRDIPRP